jgi:hypothetical protein
MVTRTACPISWKGIRVYTGRMRGQSGLAGRCRISYEPTIPAVSGEPRCSLYRVNLLPDAAPTTGKGTVDDASLNNSSRLFGCATDSTFPSATTPKELVKIAKHGWIIGRDYEGPGWRGLHHHATLCIAAYGFLVTERSHSPYIYIRAGRLELHAPELPPDFHPRGSPRVPS